MPLEFCLQSEPLYTQTSLIMSVTCQAIYIYVVADAEVPRIYLLQSLTHMQTVQRGRVSRVQGRAGAMSQMSCCIP